MILKPNTVAMLKMLIEKLHLRLTLKNLLTLFFDNYLTEKKVYLIFTETVILEEKFTCFL